MTSNKMSGNLMGLKIKGNFISCELSCDFNFETDMRPASAIDSGIWKDFILGARSWNVVVNAALLFRMAGTGANTILNAVLIGERLAVSFATKRADMPNLILSGYARVKTGSIKATVNTLGSWNVTLMGDGPFTAEINTNVTQFALTPDSDGVNVLQDGENDMLGGEMVVV